METRTTKHNSLVSRLHLIFERDMSYTQIERRDRDGNSGAVV